MTTNAGKFAWTKQAMGVANSVEANERRRREPHVIDWDKAIANLVDILDEEPATPSHT